MILKKKLEKEDNKKINSIIYNKDLSLINRTN